MSLGDRGVMEWVNNQEKRICILNNQAKLTPAKLLTVLKND